MSREKGERRRSIVADTSAVINLVASGAVREIAQVLVAPIRVVNVVVAELDAGRPTWTTRDCLAGLASEGVVELVDLESAAFEHFEALVAGTAAETLDDGEAATIAYGVTRDVEALIDERKAWRICAQRYPSLSVTTTAALLLGPEIDAALGQDRVAEVVFRALTLGRMRVPTPLVERVVRMLGDERAALCTSLPLSARAARTGPLT